MTMKKRIEKIEEMFNGTQDFYFDSVAWFSNLAEDMFEEDDRETVEEEIEKIWQAALLLQEAADALSEVEAK